MNDERLRNVIEAALLAGGRPLAVADLIEMFDEGERPSAAAVRTALGTLAADYETRALQLLETASGYRVQVRADYARELARLWPERPQKYSRALLETLALIAYRQPITRGEIELVRGVTVNPNIMRTLMERGWVRVVGHRDVPGHPELLGTTREFLDYFGLKRIDELPPLAELKAMAEIDLQMDLPVAGEGPAAEDESADAAEVADDDDLQAAADGDDARGLVAAPPARHE
jgi:segregation and condensation protein B